MSSTHDSGLSVHAAKKLSLLPPRAYLAAPQPGLIHLNQAENYVLRSELLEICKTAIDKELTEETFCYPPGFGGSSPLRTAIASFTNTYFQPSLPVTEDHVVVGGGSGNIIDALLCAICDPGDVVLSLAPVWSGFHLLASRSSGSTILPVPSPVFQESLSVDCVQRLMATYDAHPEKLRIKALLIANPHNPCDGVYAPDTIRKLMDFCHNKGLHYISDEVSALTAFNTDADTPFTSALNLVNDGRGGIQRSRVHVVYSASKDLGSPGMRIGWLISQANSDLLASVGWKAVWQVSSLSSLYITAVLTSPKLSDLIILSHKRLRSVYELLTSRLEAWGVEYVPVKAGVVIHLRIAKNAQSWEDEAAVLAKIKEKGVVIGSGRAYGIGMGWGRMLFSVKEELMMEVLGKLEQVLG